MNQAWADNLWRALVKRCAYPLRKGLGLYPENIGENVYRGIRSRGFSTGEDEHDDLKDSLKALLDTDDGRAKVVAAFRLWADRIERGEGVVLWKNICKGASPILLNNLRFPPGPRPLRKFYKGMIEDEKGRAFVAAAIRRLASALNGAGEKP